MNGIQIATRLFFAGLLCCFTLPAFAQDKTSEPVTPKSGYTLDEAGLRKLAKVLPGDRNMLHRLRPGYADLRAIASNQADAIRLYHFTSALYAGIPKNGVSVRPNEKKLYIASLSPHDKSRELPSYAPDISSHAKRLSAKVKFYALRFRDEEKGTGTLVNTLVPIHGKWVFIPSLDRALAAKKLYSTPRFAFTEALTLRRFGDAYDMLSPRVAEQVKREKFAEMLKGLGWRRHKKIDWHVSSRMAAFDGEFMEWKGMVTFQDGSTATISLYAEDAGEDALITLLDIQSRFGVNPPSMFAPQPQRCRKMAYDLCQQLVDSLNKKDFTALHASTAESLRTKITPAKIQEAFAPLAKHAEELKLVKGGQVELKFPPSIGSNTGTARISLQQLLKRRGALNVHGWVNNAKVGKRMSFQFTFQYEDKKWKPVRFTVGLPEPLKSKPKKN